MTPGVVAILQTQSLMVVQDKIACCLVAAKQLAWTGGWRTGRRGSLLVLICFVNM